MLYLIFFLELNALLFLLFIFGFTPHPLPSYNASILYRYYVYIYVYNTYILCLGYDVYEHRNPL